MRNDMRTLSWLGTVAVLGLMVAAVNADEEKVPLKDLPKKVVAAVKAKFPGAKLNSASKEKEGEGFVYEVSITDKEGHKIDVSLTPEGKITAIEKLITAQDFPAAVTKTLKAKYPGAKYLKVEDVTAGEKKYYEVVLETKDKKKFEVEISPEGKVLKTESKDKKKEAKDK
jgi:uncharacterized membrane protein YkoI